MAGEASAGGEPAVLRLLRLEASLRAGARNDVEDGVLLGFAESPTLWPFAAALAVAHPSEFDAGIVKRACTVVESLQRFNEAVFETVRTLFDAFEERETRWAMLGTALCGTNAGAWTAAPQLTPLRLLVHPYDAPRARVIAVTRGFRRTGESRLTARFENGDAVLILETGVHPRGWPAVPLSPFLETAGLAGDTPVRCMTPAAAWSAQRLLVARELWRLSTVSPAQLVELVILGRSVDSSGREMWAASAKRWGIRTLWKRCDELEAWLAGGVRPGWLDPAFGVATSRSPVPEGWPPFTLGLALQDSAVRKISYTVRRLVGR
ncbi:MAG: hypothetical protein GXP48_06010 [Acidobacteria bacterium]|nr:hypothetical protein [Acidobacteriota bacterium]